MEEIQKIALAYYANFSADEKLKAYQAFREMDRNGDGAITIDEYEEVFGPDDRTTFEVLDTNGDGKLNFEEFITFSYLVNAAMVSCDGIGCNDCFVSEVYFTCVQCFNHSKVNTFDLCPSCYQHRNFDHNHDIFLDSHFLLRCEASYLRVDEEAVVTYRNQVGSSASQRGISPQAGPLVRRTGSKRMAAKQIFDVVTGGASIGQAVFAVAGLCTIM